MMTFIRKIIVLARSNQPLTVLKMGVRTCFNKLGRNTKTTKRPIILISTCISPQKTGDFIYNGGVKLFNLWTKLLRSKGFLSYIVTYDGKYKNWLTDHQPHISLETATKWKRMGKNLRFVTTWLDASLFTKLADKLYFNDCEPFYSFNGHFPLLEEFMEFGDIVLSTETRTEQAYYRAAFRKDTLIVPPYNDQTYWKPDKTIRVTNRIGFTEESDKTFSQIEEIKQYLARNKIKATFCQVKGNEGEFLKRLQSCDLYLGLNPGKDIFHAEGLARTHMEAMSAGAVVAAFDVGGNQEFIFPDFTGMLIPNGDIIAMSETIISLIKNPQKKEYLRANALRFCSQAFTTQRSWPKLKQFLNLENFPDIETNVSPGDRLINKQEVELVLGAPAYLHDEELPIFKKHIPDIKNTIVEIGAGYGASTLLFLTYKSKTAKLYSIDKFTMAQKTKPPKGGEIPPSYEQCVNNVRNGLINLNMGEKFSSWKLIDDDSQKVVKSWREKIDLLFIDGDHSYEGVKKDFFYWFPYVPRGGLIFLHDSRRLPSSIKGEFNRGWQGPTKLARELKKRRDIKLIEEAYSLTVWEKT